MLLKQIGPELWIGCTILGGAIAVASYIICYYLIKSHRAKNPHRRYKKY
jgi:phosphotransferase system  glucose/maltose/N-acetylglucosamine-specific IIC component